MIATETKTTKSVPGVIRRHRLWVSAGALAGAVLLVALTVYGFGYYRLPAPQRFLALRHAQLKPSGTIGHPLGILGGTLFLLMFIYPLRKRWRWLSKKGKTKHWLDYHILMGLTAPFIITFHASFKLQGIAGLAYWIMMSVVASGVVGRYLYGRIPRKLDETEMSFDELQQINEQLAAQLGESKVLSSQRIERLLRLPRKEEVQNMPAMRALWTLILLDLKRPFLLLRIRREAGALILVHDQDLKEALAIVRRQSALSRNILFLSKIQKLFHLWHVVHKPFSYSFALLAVLHVAVVLLFGYF